MKLTSTIRRKFRIRNKLKKVSSKDRLRLSISRSTKNISAQIIDDLNQITVISASSNEKDLKNLKKNKSEISSLVARIETELDKNGFFFPEGKKKRMKTRLRKLFYGLDLSKEDIKILHGVVKSLVKKDI